MLRYAFSKRFEVGDHGHVRKHFRPGRGFVTRSPIHSTHSIRQTPKVAAPAMIWFLVSVEMKVPTASNRAGLQQQAQIADGQRASNPDCRI